MSVAIPHYRVHNRRDAGRFGIPPVNGHRNGNLVDHKSNPVAWDSLYDNSGQVGDGMRMRVTVPAERQGTKRAISKFDWQRSLALSRQLYAQMGFIQGAIWQKALYAVGNAWQPEYHGADAAWGEIAEDWLNDWMDVADIRGEPFDFRTDLFIDSLCFDRDGDNVMLLVKDRDQPRIQFVSSHRICQRYGSWGQDINGWSVVPSGPFAGSKAYNGVIFTPDGRKVVGYSILGDNADSDRTVTVESAQMLYEPDWSDQGRGIPKLATCLLDWMDYQDIHYFLKRQVKQDSAQGIMHYNEEGAAEDTRDFVVGKSTGVVNQDVKVEQIQGNEIMYFKALGGGKLEAYRSDRPHPNIEAFQKRIQRGCYMAMQWFFELTDPSAIGGANTRLIQDMARGSIKGRQKTLRKRALRAIRYALAVAMENGDLPRNDSDWWRWGFTMPAEMTVDQGYSDQAEFDAIKLGAGTYTDYLAKRQKRFVPHIQRRVWEQRQIEDECIKAGVDINKVQILTPNPPQIAAGAPTQNTTKTAAPVPEPEEDDDEA